ncbi:GGDEF domain-containing protein [Bacillus daqingensis]|uniref:GGDEF domain-containing protein n=1 Tax=Bacillus daqingensis TaxID=872396 RepID=A0ABV9NS04_9BACI
MSMIKELGANLAVLTTLLFLYTQFTGRYALHQTSPLKLKLFAGVMGGLLSNVLMFYSLQYGETIVDLRHIPILLLAYYGGAVPAGIAMLFVIIGRFLFGMTVSALAGSALIIAVTIAAVWIARSKLPKTFCVFWMTTAANVIFTAVIIYLLQDLSILTGLIPFYWAVSYIGAAAAFYTVEYTRRSQHLLKRYREESLTDGLTGLNNLRQFNMHLRTFSEEAKEEDKPLALLFADIDHFKRVNDTYGHREGDLVLREIAAIMGRNVRPVDIISRNGGEEFTVLLPGCAKDDANEIAERIRKAVEAHPFVLSDDSVIHVTLSIGIAAFPETSAAPETLTADADEALYEAKRSGRNKTRTSSVRAMQVF